MTSVLKTVILGTGGNCVDILDTLHEINGAASQAKYECVGFLDDNESTWGKSIHGVPVLGPLTSAKTVPGAWFVNGIGSSSTFWKKEAILAKTGVPHERFLTLVHPSARVSRFARLGFGTVVFQQVTIASNVRVGNHVVILPNSVLSHDDSVGDYTCIAGGVCVSGRVTVGKSCYLGTNSSIRDNVILGDHCLIGMGSVVLGNVAANTVVVGSPAKPLRQTRTDRLACA
jgi:sugar O-acyltransferase (sialic acid O-acetyltransferase NeuD family)